MTIYDLLSIIIVFCISTIFLQYDQRAVTEAAQHFMSLVARVIPEENSRQGQTQTQIQQSQRPPVEHEMAR